MIWFATCHFSCILLGSSMHKYSRLLAFLASPFSGFSHAKHTTLHYTTNTITFSSRKTGIPFISLRGIND